MKPHAERETFAGAGYEKPTVVDYGSLTELTAANEPRGFEDGMGKGNNGMHSHPM